QVDAAIKNLRSENIFLRRNAGNLLKNLIASILTAKEADIKTLAMATGVEESELRKFLEHLEKEGVVKEDKGKFKLKVKK
ncbi:MAG: hypothetical protein QW331_04305, partial [Candidatus Woesearchaeota archaeon]